MKKFKGAIVTHKGLEAVSGKELKELIGAECTIQPSVVLFDVNKIEDLCRLCYLSQSAIKVLSVFGSGKMKKLDDCFNIVKDADLEHWVDGKSFCVRSSIVNNDMISSLDAERDVGAIIFERYKAKVDLENPDVTFFIYIYEDDFYFGVDFAGFELSKRNYRIFSLADSIKATVAYALVRLAGHKKGMSLLDPFSHSGTVAIEAAFFETGKPVNYYNKENFAFLKFNQFDGFDFESFWKKMDKFSENSTNITASDEQQRFVKASEKNAKIAGVNKQLNFSRMDIEWLDTKFEKNSVDRIVSNPPKVSKLLTEKGIEKVFQELFYTADFILKKDGRIVLLTKNYVQILNHAQRHNFVLKANFQVWQGKEDFNVLIFERKE